jgi:hypothetical protein
LATIKQNTTTTVVVVVVAVVVVVIKHEHSKVKVDGAYCHPSTSKFNAHSVCNQPNVILVRWEVSVAKITYAYHKL